MNERDFSVIIIGAGMTGIGAAYYLRANQIDYAILEAKGDLGGVWNTHRWHGARCDSDFIKYSFSFKPFLSTQCMQGRAQIQDYLRSRERESLVLLERRAGAGRVVSGIQAAWLAARAERPEMLAVEEGYFFPARLDPDGDLLTEATDLEHPEVIDDVVDELIEAVLRRGGWVALLSDGALAGHGRVALTLRHP